MKTPAQTRAECEAQEQRVSTAFDVMDAYMAEVLGRFQADMKSIDARLAQPTRYVGENA